MPELLISEKKKIRDCLECLSIEEQNRSKELSRNLQRYLQSSKQTLKNKRISNNNKTIKAIEEAKLSNN